MRSGIRPCLAAAKPKPHRFDTLVADQRHQVSGVPGFVFNEHPAISGAHPPPFLLAAMAQALPPESPTQTS